FAANRTKSVPEADRRLYAAAYARAGGMRAGFEYFKAFEQDARDFAAFSATKLDMPLLVLTGEKASGTFLIEQARLVATNVAGSVVKGSGHWLMEEACRLRPAEVRAPPALSPSAPDRPHLSVRAQAQAGRRGGGRHPRPPHRVGRGRHPMRHSG